MARGFETGSDNERIDELQKQLDDVLDSQISSVGGNEDISIDSSRGARNAASGDSGGVRSNEPILHQITDVDSVGTPTGVFDKINIISSMAIIDHTSTPIILRFIQGIVKDGARIKITPKIGKTIDIEPGGNILTTSTITITDDDYYELVKYSEVETGVTGGAFKILLTGTGGGGNVPDGTIENEHLEWDNISMTWNAVQALTFGTTGPFAASGFNRFANDQIIAASRNLADSGDIQLKLTGAGVLDVTDSNNGPVGFTLRAQDAVNPPATFTIIQTSDLGGAGGSVLIDAVNSVNLSLDVASKSFLFLDAGPGQESILLRQKLLFEQVAVDNILGTETGIRSEVGGIMTLNVPTGAVYNFLVNDAAVIALQITETTVTSQSLFPAEGTDTIGAQGVAWSAIYGDFLASGDTDIATIGAVRLGNLEQINWRNAANNANLSLQVSGNDNFVFAGGNVDINENLLLLDIDGDTFIESVTDDLMQFTVNGSVGMSLGVVGLIVANQLTTLGNMVITTGSKLMLDSNATEAAFFDAGHTGDPSSASAGDMYYNTTINEFKFFNGTIWDSFGGGSGANTTLSNLTSPTAINQSLIPASSAVDLGTVSDEWENAYIDNIHGVAQINFTNHSITDVGSAALEFELGGGALRLEDGGVVFAEFAPLFTTLTTARNTLLGTFFTLFHNSTSPAIGDLIGIITFNANNSSAFIEPYGEIKTVITDETAGSEDGAMEFSIANASVLSKIIEIGASGGNDRLGFFGVAPVVQQSPAANSAAIITALESLGLFV